MARLYEFFQSRQLIVDLIEEYEKEIRKSFFLKKRALKKSVCELRQALREFDAAYPPEPPHYESRTRAVPAGQS